MLQNNVRTIKKYEANHKINLILVDGFDKTVHNNQKKNIVDLLLSYQ